MNKAIRQFIRYLKRRYPNSSTAKHYRSDLLQFSKFVHKPPRAVSREDVSRFVEDQLDRGLSATTINRRLAALHHFFEFLAGEAGDENWANPVVWLHHKVKPGKPLPRDASEAEITQLFAHISHPRDRAMFRLMLDLGLRAGEASALRVGDLSIEFSSPPVAQLRVRGKGNKERILWLLPETLAVVEAWLHQRPKVESDALFVTQRGQGISVRGIEDRLVHYCQAAGVRVTPHQLRHTFGRRMIEAEMPVTSLQKLLGHAQVTTTQVYIAGAGVDVRADYQAAMERLIAERPGPSLSPAAAPTFSLSLSPANPASPSAPTVASARPSRAEDEALDLSRYWESLPTWLTDVMAKYIAHRQRRWKPSQVRAHTRARLNTLRRAWRWLLAEREVKGLSHLRRADVQAYVGARLDAGIAVSTVNTELTDLWAFLRFAEAQGHPIAPAVFRVPRPERPPHLPQFLSAEEYTRLEEHVLIATKDGQRDDHLDRAWFYLLAHAGLRVSEVCDLRLGDVDPVGQRLVVREGKGQRDRAIPLSTTLVTALETYLTVRGPAQTDHLLIYRQQALQPNLIRNRLNRYGQAVEVKIWPHRLRHTLATRMLNQGMPITSIQRLLGHDKLETTMIYARVHDETVRHDFEQAMARLNQASALTDELFNRELEHLPAPARYVNCV
jgi:site-specific recombinase XerD